MGRFRLGEEPGDDEPIGPGAVVMFVALVFALVAGAFALYFLFFLVMWWGN